MGHPQPPDGAGEGASEEAAARPGALRTAWTLARRTVLDARDDRIIGVAAEVAFFVLLSLPPALLMTAGIVGFLGEDVAANVRDRLIELLGTFLSAETMDETVTPLLERLFAEGRPALVSIGAVVALWSASRMVKVLIEATNIAYDIEEMRPGWRRRLLAVGIMVAGLVVLAAYLPLLAFGPRLGDVLADRYGLGAALSVGWQVLYWPIAIGIGVGALASFYHVAPNWRTPWRRDIPGAVLAAVVWILAALALRVYVQTSVLDGGLGPLAVPIALLLWIYVTAIAVLLGAELNAEIERMWPSPEAGPKATTRLAGRVRGFWHKARRRRPRADADDEPERVPERRGRLW